MHSITGLQNTVFKNANKVLVSLTPQTNSKNVPYTTGTQIQAMFKFYQIWNVSFSCVFASLLILYYSSRAPWNQGSDNTVQKFMLFQFKSSTHLMHTMEPHVLQPHKVIQNNSCGGIWIEVIISCTKTEPWHCLATSGQLPNSFHTRFNFFWKTSLVTVTVIGTGKASFDCEPQYIYTYTHIIL
jgi:hypothetical protein